MSKKIIKIGTRASKLAIVQAKTILQALHKVGAGRDYKFQIIKINTSGDMRQSGKLHEQTNVKGVFTKEIHERLLSKEIDIAVHSVKDLQTIALDDIELISVLNRSNPGDGLFSQKYRTLHDIPVGGKVGTASIRRKAMILTQRPDLNIIPLRGNVDSRINRLKNGEFDAIILSYCGVKRLRMLHKIKYAQNLLDQDFVPSIAQGVIGVEILSGNQDTELIKYLNKISHTRTAEEVNFERYFARMLGASCQTPLGCFVKLNSGKRMAKISIFFADSEAKNPYHKTIFCGIDEVKSFLDSEAEYLKKRY